MGSQGPNFLHADSEDSDQTGRMPRLIRVFAGHTWQFVGFVMKRLIFSCLPLAVLKQTRPEIKEPSCKQPLSVSFLFS